MKKLVLFFIVAISMTLSLRALGATEEKVRLDDIVITNHDIRIVNYPTAYTMTRGSYILNLRLYSDGGVFTHSFFSFSDNFMMGVFLNASNVVGKDTIKASSPKLALKIKIMDQKVNIPAVAVGYNSIIVTETDKVDKEFYVALSRKFTLLRGILVHGGAYVTKLNNITKDDVHYYVGVTKNFEKGLGLYCEVLDPTNPNAYSINAGVKYNFSPELELELILKNVSDEREVHREIGVSYSNYF